MKMEIDVEKQKTLFRTIIRELKKVSHELTCCRTILNGLEKAGYTPTPIAELLEVARDILRFGRQ